jgi:methionyl-tRNA formyltransferase
MKITILCSSSNHPVNSYLKKWIRNMDPKHDIDLVRTKHDLSKGDLLLLISSEEIINSEYRNRYIKSLVIHASDLPKGRGWSPHIWQTLEGETKITVSLLEADEVVDSGDIWKKLIVNVPKTALWDEINHIIFEAETALMDFAVQEFNTVTPQPQSDTALPTYYRRRTPEDSQLNPNVSIRDQFDLIRVCDPDRFPAYFDLHGEQYTIRLEKIK